MTQTKTVNIEGVTFEVPASGMYGTDIKAIAKMPADSTPYIITPDGQHVIIEDNAKVELKEGDRIGTVTRFTAAGL